MENFPCSNQENCRLAESKLGCRQDVHHLFFPKRNFSRGIAKVFREIEDNKELRCRREHEDIHHDELPPPMPSVEVMKQAIAESRLKRSGEAA